MRKRRTKGRPVRRHADRNEVPRCAGGLSVPARVSGSFPGKPRCRYVRIHLVAVESGKDARNPVAFDVESAAGDEMRP